MTELVIRPAVAADSESIRACVCAAYEHYVPRLGKPPGPMLDDYAHVIEVHRVFVGEFGKDLAGVVVLIEEEQGTLLDNIAVAPGFQGRGLGSRLLDFAEAEARRSGATTLRLYTHEKMVESLALYRRRGYRETERRREKGYDRIYMVRDLRATTASPPAGGARRA